VTGFAKVKTISQMQNLGAIAWTIYVDFRDLVVLLYTMLTQSCASKSSLLFNTISNSK